MSAEIESRVAWGILGTASVSSKVFDAIRSSANAHVACVASRSAEKAKDWAEARGISKWYSSYEELIADPAVQVVYIPLPTALKYEWAKKAMAACKSVLLEKPITATAEQATELGEASERYGVQLMDGTGFVHNPRSSHMLRIAENVRHVEAIVFAPIQPNGNIRFDADLEPAGALGDLGWYCIKAILAFANWQMPSFVSATGKFSQSGVPTMVSAVFRFANGLTASFSCGFECTRLQRLDVFCEGARLQVFDFIRGQSPSMPSSAALSPVFTVTGRDGVERVVREELIHDQTVLMVEAMSRTITERQGSWCTEATLTQLVQDEIMNCLRSRSF